VAGCLPGLLVGFIVQDAVDDAVLKVVAGAVAVLVATYLPRPASSGPSPEAIAGLPSVLAPSRY
jgi:uncharacterized membrane protein YfcA